MIKRHPWFRRINTTRRHIIRICKVRIGHVCIPDHLTRIGMMSNNKCECYYESTTPLDHLFEECFLFNEQREKLITTLKTIQVQVNNFKLNNRLKLEYPKIVPSGK